MGAGNYSMRIWLDPEAMRIRNLTPDMVYQAISTQNAQVSAGYVGQPILRADNPYQYTLTVKGRLTTPDEFGNIVLKTCLLYTSYIKYPPPAATPAKAGKRYRRPRHPAYGYG